MVHGGDVVAGHARPVPPLQVESLRPLVRQSLGGQIDLGALHLPQPQLDDVRLLVSPDLSSHSPAELLKVVQRLLVPLLLPHDELPVLPVVGQNVHWTCRLQVGLDVSEVEINVRKERSQPSHGEMIAQVAEDVAVVLDVLVAEVDLPEVFVDKVLVKFPLRHRVILHSCFEVVELQVMESVN